VIETYAVLGMLTVQILVGSVLNPALFVRHAQPAAASFPVGRFTELFPGVARDRSAPRFATRYRLLNGGIVLLGLLLLGWLFMHLRRPDWNAGKVPDLLALYLCVQISPVAFMGWKAARSTKALKSSLKVRKRKAVLQRRGLFDFVSPVIVLVAGLSYLLFVALGLYVRRHPFPGSDDLGGLVIITLMWGIVAFVVYGWLYGSSRAPLATHADRLSTIGVMVRSLIYMCIGGTVFMSLDVTLWLVHLQRWELFAVSAFLATIVCLSGPRRRPTASMRHTEISLSVAELDRFVGHYELGNGFVIAIASDGAKLWWLRLDVPAAQPVSIFPEAPLAFFWKDIDQQMRFTVDANGAVTGAEVTQGRHFVTGRRVERDGFPTFSRPPGYGLGGGLGAT
jgi:hypothetical protein